MYGEWKKIKKSKENIEKIKGGGRQRNQKKEEIKIKNIQKEMRKTSQKVK